MRRGVLRGLIRLAWFRADGLAQFDGTVQAYLNSLAPLVGFAVVGAILMAANGEIQEALGDFLSTLIVLLSPAIISERLARRWDRDAEWGKFAVVLNWCQWTVPVVFFVSLIAANALVAGGSSPDDALLAAVCAVAAYGLALQWFLARRALGVTAKRGMLLVLAMNLGTGLLVLGPRVLAGGSLPG
jgi:hypothetical protein